MSEPDPAAALARLAALLREDDNEISEHVRDPADAPELGLTAAAGPGAAAAPGSTR